MCTATWWRSQEGVQIFFNRDEQRSRKKALPPRLHEKEGRRWIAPVDPQGGGTWIWVNEDAIAACLLNHYPMQGNANRQDTVSRGLMMAKLAPARSLEEADEWLQCLELQYYRAFFLLLFSLQQAPLFYVWDGRDLKMPSLDDHLPVLSTSSFSPQEVVEARKATFREQFSQTEPEPAELLNFHSHHDPRRPAHSVNMLRPDARTVSFTHLQLSENHVSMSYFPAEGETKPWGPASVMEIKRCRAS